MIVLGKKEEPGTGNQTVTHVSGLICYRCFRLRSRRAVVDHGGFSTTKDAKVTKDSWYFVFFVTFVVEQTFVVSRPQAAKPNQ
jgi:hypothetical protein